MRGFVWATVIVCLSASVATAQETRYVANDGTDVPGGGTDLSPWKTIQFALQQVADGTTILVRPGLYSGRVRLTGAFTQGVVVRSETPYLARLRADETVLTCYSCSGITIQGFDIAHNPGASALVIQIQDADGNDSTHHVRLIDNILHDSYNNDILKINNGARDILVRGNMFYNQSGSDEHIDVNSVKDVTIEDNVFFNDFAASGRTNGNDTSSFIVVKDSNGTDDAYLGSQGIRIRRNVFLNWEGSNGSNFVLLGEDGHPHYEAFDVLVENNLMLGNSSNQMRAAFGCKGVRDVVFRHNTVVGNLPSLAFAFRLNREGSNQVVSNISFYNNIWSDSTGTMEDFSDTPSGDSTNVTLSNNLYFNGGNSIPQGADDTVNSTNDAKAIEGDPQLGTLAGLTTPVWQPGSKDFRGGGTSIREVFVRLVTSYGTPKSSLVVDAADPAQSPADDILGNARTKPDLGALELGSTTPVGDVVNPTDASDDATTGDDGSTSDAMIGDDSLNDARPTTDVTPDALTTTDLGTTQPDGTLQVDSGASSDTSGTSKSSGGCSSSPSGPTSPTLFLLLALGAWLAVRRRRRDDAVRRAS